MSRTLGEMTPAERRTVIERAAQQIQRELQAAAPAIGKILDETELEDARTYIRLHDEAAQSLPRQTVAALQRIRKGELRRRHIRSTPGNTPRLKKDLVAEILKLQFPWITEARARLAQLEKPEELAGGYPATAEGARAYIQVHDLDAVQLARKTMGQLTVIERGELARAGQRRLVGELSRDELITSILELRFPAIARAREIYCAAVQAGQLEDR